MYQKVGIAVYCDYDGFTYITCPCYVGITYKESIIIYGVTFIFLNVYVIYSRGIERKGTRILYKSKPVGTLNPISLQIEKSMCVIRTT